LATLVATGSGVVLVGVPDYGLTPLPAPVHLAGSPAVGRRRDFYDQTPAWRTRRAVSRSVVDLFGFRSGDARHPSVVDQVQEVGGVEIFNSAGPDPEYAFAVDGVHPAPCTRRLTANLV